VLALILFIDGFMDDKMNDVIDEVQKRLGEVE